MIDAVRAFVVSQKVLHDQQTRRERALGGFIKPQFIAGGSYDLPMMLSMIKRRNGPCSISAIKAAICFTASIIVTHKIKAIQKETVYLPICSS